MTAPFGIEMYSPLGGLEIVATYPDSKFKVTPPKPHPSFAEYIVQATDALGVVWIKGISLEKPSDSYGNAIKAEVDRVGEQLRLRYGTPNKIDLLMQGSMWNEPQYWMNGLLASERYYSFHWEKNAQSNLPEDLKTDYVGATAVSTSSATISIEYASPKMGDAESEIDKNLSDLL
jgi:hypothetical protein